MSTFKHEIFGLPVWIAPGLEGSQSKLAPADLVAWPGQERKRRAVAKRRRSGLIPAGRVGTVKYGHNRTLGSVGWAAIPKKEALQSR